MVATTATDPAVVLFGATRRRLLGWLYTHPDEAFYFRELLRATGAPEGGAQRELAALTAAGLITRTVRGHQVFFQANPHSPIFPELASLLTKTTGIAGVMRNALAPLANRIELALLYGSAARNELRQGSDVDVLVVGDVQFDDVVRVTSSAESTLGREVNPSVYAPAEFRTKLQQGHHFLTSVLREPYIVLLGDPNDVERLGTAQQVAGSAPDVKGGDSPHARHRRSQSARQPRRRAER